MEYCFYEVINVTARLISTVENVFFLYYIPFFLIIVFSHTRDLQSTILEIKVPSTVGTYFFTNTKLHIFRGFSLGEKSPTVRGMNETGMKLQKIASFFK